MDKKIGVFAVCALTMLSQTVAQSGRTVQINGMEISPDHIPRTSLDCVWATVSIDVTPTSITDGPTLEVSVVKSFSMPPELNVDITPGWIDATLSGPAEFRFKVCPRGGPGKITLVSAILGVAPEDKFIIPERNPAKQQAELTIDP